MMNDDAQFVRDSDFNKPFRPFLPRADGVDTAQGPFGGPGAQPAGPVRYYDNPFRRSPDDAITQANRYAQAGQRQGGFTTRTPAGFVSNGIAAPDPITQEIDRSLVQLRDSIAPSMQGGVGFRTRSGDSGLDKLTEVSTPLQTQFSPGGHGTVTIGATPVMLDSGTLGGDDANLQRFGTYAPRLIPPVQGGNNYVPAYLPTGYTRPSAQTAKGVGFSLAYRNQALNLDVGTSPIGFKSQNLLGGVELAPQLNDKVRLRFGIERRSVTDSVLSWAGTADPVTGTKWGGVVRNRAHGGIDFTIGGADFYVGGGAGQLTGRHVTSNTQVDMGAGGSYPVYKQGNEEVRVGLDVAYLSYSKNLRFFTLGQGGYFSPQNYISTLIPVTYRTKIDEDVELEVGAAIGLQSFNEKASNYYPKDPGLQAFLNSVPNFQGLDKVYKARSQSGFAGNVHGKLDYRVAPNFHLGGQIAIQHSASFDEAAGLFYAKYIFNGTEK
jgi:hypothetical protein